MIVFVKVSDRSTDVHKETGYEEEQEEEQEEEEEEEEEDHNAMITVLIHEIGGMTNTWLPTHSRLPSYISLDSSPGVYTGILSR